MFFFDDRYVHGFDYGYTGLSQDAHAWSLVALAEPERGGPTP